MNCPICCTDLSPSEIITLKCSCTHCQDCLTTWIVSKIQEPSFSNVQTVICMQSECKQFFSPQEALPQFSTSHKETINLALTHSYLTNAQDIRKCPKEGCNYAGIINIKNPCKESLECESCGFQWRDPANFTKMEKISARIKDWDLLTNEFMSSAWQEIRTRTCVKCGVNIEKNGGCPHMTCKNCNHEFCWHCGMQWRGHVYQTCYMVILGKVLLVGFPIFHILGLFRLLPVILGAVWWLICFLFQFVVFNGSGALMSNFYKKSRYSDSSRFYWGIGFVLGMLLAYVYYFDLWKSLLTILMMDIVMLGVGYSSMFVKIWVKNVF